MPLPHFFTLSQKGDTVHLKLNSGIVGKGFEFQPGDIVDWREDDAAKRFIERGLATQATKEQIQAAAERIKVFIPAKPRPEDRWPPRLRELPKDHETEKQRR